MSKSLSLKDLSLAAEIFGDTLSSKIGNDSSLQQKFEKAVSFDELETAFRLPEVMAMDLKDKTEEDLLLLFTAAADSFAKLASRAMSDQELAECLPDHARNEETSKAFEEQGMKKLAQICAYKP